MENLIVTSEKPTEERFYIYPLFDMHQEIKLNARWDSQKVAWYVTSREDPMYELYKIRYLVGKLKNIDTYVEHNARWDGVHHRFYTYNSNKDLEEYFVKKIDFEN